MQRPRGSDDIARAVFSVAEQAGSPVPHAQTTWLANEVSRLVGDNFIVGYADAQVGDAPYLFAILGDTAYLLRWHDDNLEATFLGQLVGLKYRELTHGLGAMPGFQGEPSLRIEIEQELLPGELVLQADDWLVGELQTVRDVLRKWIAGRPHH
jgi:hypothetical protein